MGTGDWGLGTGDWGLGWFYSRGVRGLSVILLVDPGTAMVGWWGGGVVGWWGGGVTGWWGDWVTG